MRAATPADPGRGDRAAATGLFTAPLRVTVSAGSAATSGGTTVEALLQSAREALARAKSEGRDRAVESDAQVAAA